MKLFAHRGYLVSKNSEPIKENSVLSLKNAFDNSFRAIEFDIWLFGNQLVLKHDNPNRDNIDNLAKIDDYFCFGNKINYWLDFKNLNISNCEETINLLKISLKNNNISLNNLYFAPYNLNYAEVSLLHKKFVENFGEVKFLAILDSEKDKAEMVVFREFLTKNNIKHLSVFHELINEEFIKDFSDIELFAWTVNDLERLEFLNKIGVKNFATDTIIPKLSH